MGSERRRRAGLGDLADMAERIDRDGATCGKELRKRDREIGRRLEDLKHAPAAQLLAWMDLSGGSRNDLPGSSVERAYRLGMALLLMAGMLLGWLAAAAVFYYDGRHPVNIINILAVFVFFQILLLALLALSLAPPALLRSLPGAGTLMEILDMMRPGRLLVLIARRLPEGRRMRALAMVDGSRRQQALYGRVGKWLLTFASQIFGSAFNTGAILGALHLVFFTDLAFSWSTTLKVTAAGVHKLTSMLSAPWAAWLPAASPSPALVESSRYFRLQGGYLPSGTGISGNPEVLGEWWPFLIMTMLVYGLLPRLLLLAFAALRLRDATADSLLHYPGVPNILERMNGPLVDTTAREAESVGSRPGTGVAAAPGKTEAEGFRTCINWGEVPHGVKALADALGPMKCAGGEMLSAGGGNTMEEDRDAIHRAAGMNAGGAAVIVRSWEPPMDDLLDFLSELRQALGRTRPVTIVLAGPPEGDGAGEVGEVRAEIWNRKLRSLADPWLSVLPDDGGAP